MIIFFKEYILTNEGCYITSVFYALFEELIATKLHPLTKILKSCRKINILRLEIE